MFTLGDVPNLAPMLAMIAGLIIATHIVVGGLAALSELVSSKDRFAASLRKNG